MKYNQFHMKMYADVFSQHNSFDISFIPSLCLSCSPLFLYNNNTQVLSELSTIDLNQSDMNLSDLFVWYSSLAEEKSLNDSMPTEEDDGMLSDYPSIL